MSARVVASVLVVNLAVGLAGAQNPGGSQPPREGDCDQLTGTAGRLCVAYCEREDCDADADHPVCSKLLTQFTHKTGEARFPCEEIALGECLESAGQEAPCVELGGGLKFDATCPAVSRSNLLFCVGPPAPFSAELCTSRGGVLENDRDCRGLRSCIREVEIQSRCLERLCPSFDDEIKYVSVDNATGDAVIENLDDGRVYECEVIFDGAGDGFNCRADPRPGDVADIPSLGLSDSFCQGEFNIGVDIPGGGIQECSYRCQVI